MLFKTKSEGETTTLYNTKASSVGVVPAGTILDCADWIWPSDKPLAGMRTVYTISGTAVSNRFVKDADLISLSDTPTEPPVEPPTGDTITYPAGQLQLQTPQGTFQNLEPVTLTKATG